MKLNSEQALILPVKQLFHRISGGSRLRIKSAKLVDSGIYLCLALRKDGKPEFSNTARVTVRAKSK